MVETARRELVEEIQTTATDCQHFANVAPDSALLGHVVGLTVASIPHAGSPDLKEVEHVIEIPIEQVHQMVASDEILDGFTLALYGSAIAKGLMPPR